jgi:hypothetical protein
LELWTVARDVPGLIACARYCAQTGAVENSFFLGTSASATGWRSLSLLPFAVLILRRMPQAVRLQVHASQADRSQRVAGSSKSRRTGLI